jgi:RNA polymerase sigma-70 factor (ECF subfamily)
MPPEPLPPQSPERVRWFANEVQPHEPALRAYLRNSFPVVRDVDDVVQESYLRLWQERAQRPVSYAKALLFKVARHLAIDFARRDRISPEEKVGDLERLNVIEEGADVVAAISRREKSRMLAQAIDSLPARCREIVILRKLQMVPQREVAARLGLAEKTVEAQLARGVKRCEEFLRKRGLHHHYTDETP